MTPNFALSLTLDGIALLRQARAGWVEIDAVALDGAELERAMASLLASARAQAPNGTDVLLVLPNEQIRYLDLPAPDAASEAAETADLVRAALDGATPYAVEELAFDWSVEGGRILAAAVALETLEEAESFVAAQGFRPVGFTAMPPEGSFAGAVDLGRAQGWTGEAPARLPAAIRILSAAEAETPDDSAPADTPATAQEGEQPPPADGDAKGSAAPDTAAAEPDVTAPQETKAQASDKVQDTPAQADAAAQAPSDSPAETVPSGNAPPAATPAPAPLPTAAERVRFSGGMFGPGGNARADTIPASASETPVLRASATEGRPGDAAPDLARFSSIRATRDLPETTVSAPDTATAPVAARGSSLSVAAPEDAGAAPALGAATGAPPARTAEAPAAPSRTNASAAAPARSKPVAEPAPAKSGTAPSPARPKAAPNSSEAKPKPRGGGLGAIAAHVRKQAPAPKPAGRAASTARAASAQPAPAPAMPAPTEAASPKARPAAARADAKPKPGKRRKRQPPEPVSTATQAPTGADTGVDPDEERRRMTVFGARREEEIGGKPRFLGLMLTAALLVFLAAIAAWAAVFLDNDISRLFAPRERAETPEIAALPEAAPPEAAQPEASPAEDAASPETGTPAAPEETAETLPALPPAPRMSNEEASTRYAATGIWQRAPTAPHEPGQGSVEDLYIASVDPAVGQFDAIALPPSPGIGDDITPGPIALPPGPNQRFDLDENGLVRATPEGAISPDGVRVFTGPPPQVPPRRPNVDQPEATDAPEDTAAAQIDDSAPASATESEQSALAQFRPRPRPEDLAEQTERAALAGNSREELAALRPVSRPDTVIDSAIAEALAAPQPAEPAPAPDAGPPAELSAETETAPAPEIPQGTALAIPSSPMPQTRPGNIGRIVERAERENVQTASAAAVRIPQGPRVPQNANVAREATVRNQLNLRQTNLIGVFGTQSNRRALVRLSNGRLQNVKVGDRLDGGRVAAIGEEELRLTKGGRNIVLRMPSG